ncbi:MAG: GH25 family lysozyme [Bacteroidota bacterium]
MKKNRITFLLVIISCLFVFYACQAPTNTNDDNPPNVENTTNPPEPIEKEELPAEVSRAIGIDISHNNGQIEWDKLKSAGIDFVFIKATQGETFVDPMFSQNGAQATNAGLPWGAYHFYQANDDPITQANFFLSTLVDAEGASLPVVLDIEQASVTGNFAVDQLSADLLSFLKTVESGIGLKPIIYTDVNFGNEYLTNPEFADYPLWIADYAADSDNPSLPETWKDKGWLFWQNASDHQVPGVQGNSDHNFFNGDIEALMALIQAN